jgi:adenylate cyclase
MKRGRLLRMKNGMLLANLVSNLIGLKVNLFLSGVSAPLTPEIMQPINSLNTVFSPCAFVFGLLLTLIYEQPLRSYLTSRFHDRPASDELLVKARRRCLNEPFFLVGMDFGIWLVAAGLFPVMAWSRGAGPEAIRYLFSLNMNTGLITSIVAFFVLEKVLQKRLAPFLFPEGGLYMTPRTLRIRIGTRLTALLLACNVIPFFSFMRLAGQAAVPDQDPLAVIDRLSSIANAQALVFIATGIWATLVVSGNLTRPLRSIIEVLSEIRRGNLDTRVDVSTNDEIGYTGDVINQMTQGLKERALIKEMFGRYVTPEIRDEILSGRIPLDGEIRVVTVLFADLRDFTPLTQALPPREVVKIINSYFKEMEEAIHSQHGLILQFIGDEIEAVFGAPIARPDHPVLAVRAALEMAQRLRKLNAELERRQRMPLRHGIGVHTGEALAANIGSPSRLAYALVGETVNLASRLQGLNKTFGTEIIASGATCAHLNGAIAVRRLPATPIKGIAQPIDIFSIA